MSKRFLVKHVGNMGDMIFFIPPVLRALKHHYPGCHITFVTAWGFKDKKGRWGKRNQSGFCISLVMANPDIDQLVHWYSSRLSLEGDICVEEGKRFPTWNAAYWQEQKASGAYDGVYELDFGIGLEDNPMKRMYEAIGRTDETYTNYQLHLTPSDHTIAQLLMDPYPRPRIFLLEGIESSTTRGWDPGKVRQLELAIKKRYGVPPLWFGGKYIPEYQGRPLSLRENIARLTHGDVAIGVLSGPLHFAAAVGLPTITLYSDHPVHRAAPAFFLNTYIKEPQRWHRTLLGPDGPIRDTLKNDHPSRNLTPAEAKRQGSRGWLKPGRQATKTGLAAITVDEVLTVLADVLPPGRALAQ